MYASTFTAAFFAVLAAAAPASLINLEQESSPEDAIDVASKMFESFALSIQKVKHQPWSPPTCNMSNIVMPTEEGMPGPDAGLRPYHVALGRGTQNYTCDTSDPTSAPVAAGALATLFNVTCWDANWGCMVDSLPSLAVHFSKEDMERTNPWGLSVSGHHFFADATTPYFDLNTPNGQLGVAPSAKVKALPAPANAAKGPNGSGAVSWLKLHTDADATHGITNVFRTSTAGGSAPATCKGLGSHVEVQYSALYFFWAT